MLEDMEEHGKDLLKKKEAKVAKIKEKKKLEFNRAVYTSSGSVSQMEREHVEHGEELFQKHLEEIKTMNEEKVKK